MLKHIVLGLACIGAVSISQADPIDKVPRIKRLIDVSAPEIYNVKITLESGKVIELDKVAFTERSLQMRFTMNSIDKTVRVLPKGATERITINVSEIESINFTKVKDEDKPQPEKQPV